MIFNKTPELLRIALVICHIPLVSLAVGYQDEEIKIPDNAHTKAIEALKELGPERGALKLDFRVVTIEGVIRGVTSESEKIQAALDDLGAKKTETEYIIELPGDILFDFDKWSIRKDAEESLAKVADILAATQYSVSIIGHTDAKGAEAYNLELSKNRADAVKSWLVDKASIDSSRIETSGKGESEPTAPNSHPDGTDNPEGRKKNRRVEIRIHKE
jgi:outer membrane protein OmpA-like peptidoglycan-associated protein